MHTRARARTRTHTLCGRIRKDPANHVCALHCTHDRQRASLAATGYNLLPLTYYSLGVERLFARQLQPPKVCGPQALLHAAARPEHRTVGSHVSTCPRAWRVLPGAEGPHWGAGGGGRARGCLAPLWSECCSPVESRQEIAGTPGAPRGEGWGDGQVGEGAARGELPPLYR